MEKRKVVISIVLAVWILALIFTFYYLYNIYSDITAPNSIPAKLNSQYVEIYTLSPFSPNKLILGGNVEVTKGDIIPLSVKNEDYSLKVFEINSSDNKVDLIVNNFLYFSLKNSETKKLDLNGDNYYDIMLTLKDISNSKATLFIKSINEKKAVEDKLNEALFTIKQSSDIQSKLVILISLIFIIILVLYFIKSYLAPAISLKRRTAREKPTSVLDYLLDEFDNSKRAGNNKDARKIINKAKNLYRHMPDEDKRRFTSRMKKI
jgi:hypothetical protein